MGVWAFFLDTLRLFSTPCLRFFTPTQQLPNLFSPPLRLFPNHRCTYSAVIHGALGAPGNPKPESQKVCPRAACNVLRVCVYDSGSKTLRMHMSIIAGRRPLSAGFASKRCTEIGFPK